MGDNLVPNGLSRGCRIFCSRSSERELIFPNPDGGQFSENAMLAVLGNRAIILRFAVLENHRQSRPLVDVIEERGIKTGADIVRYAAYAHHEMARPVIGRPQV